MPAWLRSVLGVIVGLVVGGSLNMGIIVVGSMVLPPPEGVDAVDPESINANLDRYTVVQLMVPIVAHAAGTLVGAMLATLISASKSWRPGLFVGGFFLVGGIMAVRMMPNTPLWFAVVDLGGAYIPMGWLGWRMMSRRSAR